jgi:hypothetical protein
VIIEGWYGHPDDDTKRDDVTERLHFVQQLGQVGGQLDMAAAGDGFLTLLGTLGLSLPFAPVATVCTCRYPLHLSLP